MGAHVTWVKHPDNVCWMAEGARIINNAILMNRYVES